MIPAEYLGGIGSVQFCHVFQDHIYHIIISSACPWDVGEKHALKLTDVVIEPDEGPTKLYSDRSARVKEEQERRKPIPLSPFMMTHILEPTHLSMSSIVCQLRLWTWRFGGLAYIPNGRSCDVCGAAMMRDYFGDGIGRSVENVSDKEPRKVK